MRHHFDNGFCKVGKALTVVVKTVISASLEIVFVIDKIVNYSVLSEHFFLYCIILHDPAVYSNTGKENMESFFCISLHTIHNAK